MADPWHFEIQIQAGCTVDVPHHARLADDLTAGPMDAAASVRLELEGSELDVVGVIDEEAHQAGHLIDIAVIDGGVEEKAQAKAPGALDVVEAETVERLLALVALALLGQVNVEGDVQKPNGRERP